MTVAPGKQARRGCQTHEEPTAEHYKVIVESSRGIQKTLGEIHNIVKETKISVNAHAERIGELEKVVENMSFAGAGRGAAAVKPCVLGDPVGQGGPRAGKEKAAPSRLVSSSPAPGPSANRTQSLGRDKSWADDLI